MAVDKPDVGPSSGRGSAKFKVQGHTASAYGSDPSYRAQGDAGKEPRELRP